MRAQGRPLTDLRMYYSDEHRRVLASCAVKANWILWDRAGLHVNPEELMAEGWWHCLRRCPTGNVTHAIGNTIRAMVEYGLSFYVRRGWGAGEEMLDQTGKLDAVEIRDEIGFLQDHMDRNQFQLVRNLTSGIWSVREVARYEHASKNTVCARAKQARKTARQLLGVRI